MLSFLSGLTLLVLLLMPWIILIVAPGFKQQPEKFPARYRTYSNNFSLPVIHGTPITLGWNAECARSICGNGFRPYWIEHSIL